MRNYTRLALICSAAAAPVAFIQGCSEQTPTNPKAVVPNAPQLTQAVLPEFPGANQFVAVIDNPYYPLIRGTTFEYRSVTPEGVETNTVEVTHETKTILGVAVTVVHDQVFLDGELTEDTFDWFAQDTQGNIWYLGEASCEIEDDKCISTEGSWEAGVEGAQPGIIMWADPAAHKGNAYRQEYFAGEAEDVGKVLSLKASVETPYGSFTGCLETADWSLLDSGGAREHKFYCPGTGLLLEVASPNGKKRSELVAIDTP